MSMHNDRVTPEDIRSKLTEIQGEATEQVESAKNQLLAAGVLLGLLLLIAAFLLGRRGGKRSSAVIEVRRA
ncbi:MAG: hypothetical protein R2714_00315 [Microthrixaceae bacterium]|nr:hypothetical protein [Microthrixaceae bacterium]MCB1010952.1 hypothetical protein [Microthrixaceae bacterium]MCO5319973.1 hypothetical protein [Microthrixaceae bacterium]